MHLLYIDSVAHGSVRRDFGVHMKVDRLIKIYVNATYTNVRVGKNLFDAFTIQNGLKQGDAI
jgi:hypothetical protein